MGTSNARFEVLPDIPKKLRIGFLKPNKGYNVHVRFSNASGIVQPDSKWDLRGIAVRISLEDGHWHDLLMTNAAASHERNALQFMDFASAAAGSKFSMVPKLLWKIGPLETQFENHDWINHGDTSQPEELTANRGTNLRPWRAKL